MKAGGLRRGGVRETGRPGAPLNAFGPFKHNLRGGSPFISKQPFRATLSYATQDRVADILKIATCVKATLHAPSNGHGGPHQCHPGTSFPYAGAIFPYAGAISTGSVGRSNEEGRQTNNKSQQTFNMNGEAYVLDPPRPPMAYGWRVTSHGGTRSDRFPVKKDLSKVEPP